MTLPSLSPDSSTPDAAPHPTFDTPARPKIVAILTIALVLIMGALIAVFALASWGIDQPPLIDNGSSSEAGQPAAPDGTSSTKAVTILDQFFGREPASSGEWWYVITLDNPSSKNVYVEVPLSVSTLDVDGTVLETHDQSVTLGPGPNLIVGTFFDVGADEVNSLDATLASDAVAIPVDADSSRLKLSDIVSVTDVASRTAVVRGEATNTSGSRVENSDVIVLAATISGAGLGYVSAPIPALAPGEETEFEAHFPSGVAPGTQFHPIAQP